MLRPESVREMHRPQALLYTPDDDAYGLTFFLKTYKGLQQVRHDGGISTFGCRLALLPEKGTAVIMTFNRWLTTADALTEHIFDVLLNLPKQRAEPPIVEPDRSLWSNYCGTYLGQWRGLAKIEAEDDRLMLQQNDMIIPLQAVRKDLYIGQDADDKTLIPVGFPPSSGPTPCIYVNSFVHLRTELTTVPDPGRWKNYEGIYAIEGIDTYTVRIVEDELRIYSKNDNLEIALTPVDATRFGCTSWGIFEFLTTENGEVSAVKQGPSWIFQRVPL